MLKKKNRKALFAQTVIEYTMLISIITLVAFAMMHMIKRGTQSLIKTTADQLAVQKNSDQFAWDNRAQQWLPEKDRGYLVFQNVDASVDNKRQMVERLGMINYIQDERQDQRTLSQTNMGFTEEN